MFTPHWWVPSGVIPEISLGSQVKRSRRENRGAEGVGFGEECSLLTGGRFEEELTSGTQGFTIITPSLALAQKNFRLLIAKRHIFVDYQLLNSQFILIINSFKITHEMHIEL
jgi:hypothetical protein